MPLTHTRDLFAKALKGKYALGAFNVNNMELLQAIIEACEEEKAPVMLQISKGARQYANPVYLKKLIEAAVSLSKRTSRFAKRSSTTPTSITAWSKANSACSSAPSTMTAKKAGVIPRAA